MGGAGGLLDRSAQTFNAQTYVVTVGAGATADVGLGAGSNGSDSSIDALFVADGGGGGGSNNGTRTHGSAGGSGGGGSVEWYIPIPKNEKGVAVKIRSVDFYFFGLDSTQFITSNLLSVLLSAIIIPHCNSSHKSCSSLAVLVLVA